VLPGDVYTCQSVSCVAWPCLILPECLICCPAVFIFARCLMCCLVVFILTQVSHDCVTWMYLYLPECLMCCPTVIILARCLVCCPVVFILARCLMSCSTVFLLTRVSHELPDCIYTCPMSHVLPDCVYTCPMSHELPDCFSGTGPAESNQLWWSTVQRVHNVPGVLWFLRYVNFNFRLSSPTLHCILTIRNAYKNECMFRWMCFKGTWIKLLLFYVYAISFV